MTKLMGCYLTTKNMNICKIKEYGIYTKIMSQLSVFETRYKMFFLAEGWKKDIFRKLLARLPIFPNEFSLSSKKIPECIDFLFYRFDLGDRKTIKFLRNVKVINPKCKIIVEIPTYPLQWENFKWYTKILRSKHTYCEMHLQDVADIAVVYDKRETLYGLKTIQISNGIITDCIPLRKFPVIDNSDINIISVSSMSRLHGIDRMIIGIGQYYCNGGNRNIIFHVVGYGSEMSCCQKLVEMYSIHEHVIFHGYQTGEPLRKIFEVCDIGVDMLGGHRITDANFSSTLKSREYWANGMVLISSAQYSEEVNEISKYIFKAPSDESPIDVSQLINFYDTVFDGGKHEKKQEVEITIRDFVKKHYDMRVVLSPLFEYIEGQ